MELQPDPIWSSIVVGDLRFEEAGPVTLKYFRNQVTGWESLIDARLDPDGPIGLLRTCRSLYLHSYYDATFQTIAMFISLQAVEAALREIFPEMPPNAKFDRLLHKAHKKRLLGPVEDAQVKAVLGIRNSLAHPNFQVRHGPWSITSVIDYNHRIVSHLLAQLPNKL